MFRSVVIFLFSMGLTCPQAESGVLSGVSKAARIAKEVSKTASKAAASQKKNPSVDVGLPSVGTTGLTTLLSENGFYILNPAIQTSRAARDVLREKEKKCQKKIKLNSSLKVYEKADVTSVQRLIFNEGEIVCIRSQSEDWVWAKTGFGWIKLK